MNNRCYILSASQVSCQKPLCEEWMTTPIWYNQSYARAVEPDTKEFIIPSEARRMSKILKRAICSAITALNISRIKQPDAIITGTGAGCLENSEKFLIDMSNFGENCLKPTLFMQSTHNTISSLIAIILKCHGYNNTYSHKGISFDSALLDAWLQIKLGSIKSALIGSHDEVTPFMDLIIEKTNPMYKFVSESDVSVMISSQSDEVSPLCEITSVELLYKPDLQDVVNSIKTDDYTALILGVNGNEQNDKPYLKILECIPSSVPIIKYKHVFGENYSSSSMAMYVAAHLLSSQSIPEHMLYKKCPMTNLNIRELIIINHSDMTAWSIVKLNTV